MDHSATFARHFARLGWLLLREPANIDEQKVVLRALVTVSRAGAVTLERRDVTIAANGHPVPQLLSGVAELREGMAACGVSTIEVDPDASPADVLAAARWLAGIAAAAPGPTVRLVGAMMPVAEPAPAEVAPPVQESAPAPKPVLRSEDGLFEHFAASGYVAGAPESLLAALDVASGISVLTRLLDDLVHAAEQACREGDLELATEIFYGIIAREHEIQDYECKRAFMLTVRRLSQGALLRAVAQGLVKAPHKRLEQLAVLTRAGEDGADVLIEQLVAAAERSERRVYFDALLELRAGVPTLLHMLGDPRWFVARNAATLLGELQAREAEQQLAALLHHDDERVRHAATIALMRLGTPRSMPAIEHALRDSAPQIRMQAAAALAEHREDATAEPLLRALDAERDDEVKAAFLIALGRLASSEAVERLIAAAQPERGLFRKKVLGLRVAAVQGLAAAGTPLALDALVRLQADRERDVQRAALQALEAWGAGL
jgi:HEAT repeat protein